MEAINIKNKLRILSSIFSFDIPITRKFILIYFSISLIAFFFILIGGRILTLSADELYFLSEAYKIKQDWNEIGLNKSFSMPYDLYHKFLSIFITKESPSSIWFAVIFDSLNQILCILLLTFLSFKFHLKPKVTLFILIVTGILFCFTIGRLAEHRPDYLAVTFLTISYLLLIHLFLEHKTKNNLPAILGGICLGLAICFSPRSLVLVVFSLPIIALYVYFTYTIRCWLRILILWTSSMALTFLTVSWLFDFQVWEPISFLLNDDLGSDNDYPLKGRFINHVRLYQSAIMFVILFSSAAMLKFSILSKKQKLLLFFSVSISLAQIGLIILDKGIQGYGYNYGLAAYIAFILAVYEGWRKPKISIMWFVTPLIFSIIFMLQVRHFVSYPGYHFNSKIVLSTNVNKDSSVEELLNNINVGPRPLVNSLNTRISLCEKFKNARFISEFNNNMICMESHYSYHNKSNEKIDTVHPYFFFYPRSTKELQKILLNYGLNKNSAGILILPNEDGSFDSHDAKYLSY